MNQWSFERINAFAEVASGLHGAARAAAGYGVGLFAGPELGGCWIGRCGEGARVAGAITAGGATLLALAILVTAGQPRLS